MTNTSPPEGAATDCFARQAELVPRGRLADLSVTVIGVGAVGRQAALQLACLGVPRLTLVDFDAVEPTNVTTQGYAAADVGRAKVAATAEAVHRTDPAIDVSAIEDRYRPSLNVGEAVFCGVDSIAARAAIWRAAGRSCRFWCDGRMLGETIRVLAAADGVGREHYPTTLFAPAEAEPGRCTVYTANIALHGEHRRRTDAASVRPLAPRPAGRTRSDAEPARRRADDGRHDATAIDLHRHTVPTHPREGRPGGRPSRGPFP